MEAARLQLPGSPPCVSQPGKWRSKTPEAAVRGPGLLKYWSPRFWMQALVGLQGSTTHQCCEANHCVAR